MRPAGGIVIEIPDSAGGAPHKVEVFEQASEQFAARLRKVFKERRKWAAREGVTCYRVYDSDLPDYAVAIDVYTGAGDARGNTYLHIAEYAPPASVDPVKARHRFNDALAIAPIVCNVRPDHVFSKTRIRDKGGSHRAESGWRAVSESVRLYRYSFGVRSRWWCYFNDDGRFVADLSGLGETQHDGKWFQGCRPCLRARGRHALDYRCAS